MKRIFAADNQSAGIFGGDDPLGGPGSAETIVRSVERRGSPSGRGAFR